MWPKRGSKSIALIDRVGTAVYGEAMQAKKSLGQHFLRSPHYLALIAESARLKPGEIVLEIGPGEGTLTEELLARGVRVVAIEKDRRFVPQLKEKFKNKKFEAHEADILQCNIANYLKSPYKLVGNIPYYITGALFKKFLSGNIQPSLLVFLVQKEVGERIAKSNKESILSLSVKAYGTPRYLKTIPRGAFSPPPKVDSALLVVENISRKNFKNVSHERRFFELVRAGFAHKRKQLASNLKATLGKNHSSILQNARMAPNARAEDVALKQWLALAQN